MAVAKKKEHNLPEKKTFKIVTSDKHATLYKVVYNEGGNVPKELSGLYNSKVYANKDIKLYLDNKKENKSYLDHVRDKENGKIKKATEDKGRE